MNSPVEVPKLGNVPMPMMDTTKTPEPYLALVVNGSSIDVACMIFAMDRKKVDRVAR